MFFQTLYPLVAVSVAVLMDLSTCKVRNWWIMMLWCTAFVYQLLMKGYAGVFDFLWGSLSPIVILFPLFRLRMLGPGDIKVFSALGSIMGVESVCMCMMVSIFCGGVLALGILVMQGNLISRLRYFTEYIRISVCNRKIYPYYQPGSRPENLHFTVAIFMGVMLYVGGFY